MLDFICEMDRVIKDLPTDGAWTAGDIAGMTDTPIPKVIDCLADALGRDIDVGETVNIKDLIQALNIMKQRMHAQLAARARRVQRQRDRAIRAYDLSMEKVRILQKDKNWHSAYRTLSYFIGKYEGDMPDEHLLPIYEDCLRLGFKARANLQELGLWLYRCVDLCQRGNTREGLTDAMDVIDTYSEFFVGENQDRGGKILHNALGRIQDPAQELELAAEYEALARTLAAPSL